MTSALFVTYDAGGNVPPALGIAQRLAADGGRALVLGTPSQRAIVEAAGLQFEAFSAEQSWQALAPMNLVTNLSRMSRTNGDRTMAKDVVRVARRESPDAVVVDCMLLRPLDASIQAGFRTVSLVHSLPSFFAGPFAHGPVGQVAALRGLRPARIWAAARGSIATVLPGFDTGKPGPWADLRMVGPITPAPAARAAARADAERRGRPRVLISLSTIWFPGQDRTMQKLLDAVAGLDLDAVVTTGRSIDPASLRSPANAQLRRLADHDALLADADLVVGHGGHGTTMRALAHDVPLLIVPSFAFTDQPTVARRIQENGAGRTLAPKASVADLRRAIAELVASGPHHRSAAALGTRIRALDPAGTAVGYLGELAADFATKAG